jgi:hypothetical protein
VRRLPARPVSHVACLGFLLAGATATPPPPAPPAPSTDGAAVHVTIETFAIDRKGTWSAGSDEADLIPGTPGVLEKSITLVGRDKSRTQEKVTVKARFTPDATTPEGAACALRADFETRRDAAAPESSRGSGASGGKPAKIAANGPVDRRDALVTLAAGEERLIDVYASPLNEGRIAMRVRCAPSRAEEKPVPDMLALDLSVEKDAEGEPAEILRSQRLLATLGHEAGTVVTAHATLPDAEDGSKRYRRTQLDVTLTPLIVVAGKLQIEVHLTGEIATIGAAGRTQSYPIERSETYIVAPSEPRSFKVEIVARGADEGWKQVTLTVDLIARF